MQKLLDKLMALDGRGYPAYKSIKGSYSFDGFTLEITHVQGDPFAAPSRLTVSLSLAEAGIAADWIQPRARCLGFEDAILRSCHEVVRRIGERRGSGKSGEWGIQRPGQEMLPRTACEIHGDRLNLRMTIGLPAQGRRILGGQAKSMFATELPKIITEGVLRANKEVWQQHAHDYEDQEQLRHELKKRRLVAFIADGATLPRASGVDDRPLKEAPTLWQSPPELRCSFDLPNGGRVEGSGIPEGVTLICGGGFHGKSTLLQTIARGVYNHMPTDGRERCVTLYEAVQVLAEEGRSVVDVDISGFIQSLPGGKSTSQFSTENASGSTSQAASIVEAIEVGAKLLLIDEDTAATNFMVRDRRMQEMVRTDKEPITPFIDRVRELYDVHGISTVLVVGGAGDYFEHADTVIVMDSYKPRLATGEALEIAKRFASNRLVEERGRFVLPAARLPKSSSFDARRGHRKERVRAIKQRAIDFGRQEIDVAAVAQIVDDGQTRTLGDWLLRLARDTTNQGRSLGDLCGELERLALTKSLSEVTAADLGDRVFARRFELAAAINRLRSLKIK